MSVFPFITRTRRTLSLIIALLLVAGRLNAQVTEEIEIDFSTKALRADDAKKLSRLRQGDMLQVKITKLNPLLYKVAVGLRDTVRSPPIPFPSFSTVGLDEIIKLVGAFPKLSGINASLDSLANTKKKGRGVRAVFDPSAEVVLLSGETNKQKAQKILDSYQGKLKEYVDLLVAQNARIDDLQATYNKYFISAKLEFDPVLTDAFQKKNTLENLFTKLESYRMNLALLEVNIQKASDAYAKQILPFKTTVSADPGLKAADEKALAVYQKLTEDLTKVKARISPEASQKYMDGIVTAINAAKREYLSMPLQVLNNQSSLAIKILPRNTDTGLHDYTFNLIFPVQRHLFWGLSSGIYVSKLFNEAYSTNTLRASVQDTVFTYGLKAEHSKQTFGEFGASAMVRIGWTWTPAEVGWQFGFGPAIAVSDKVRPRVLLGTGPVIGKNQKFMLDVGCGLGYVDRLSSVYDVSGTYFEKPTDVVVSRLDANFYFSLNYLFYK